MTQQQSVGVLAAFALVAGVCGFVIWRNYSDEEMLVYVALAQSIRTLPGIEGVALMSAVSTCRASDPHFPPEHVDLLKGLMEANGSGSSPRALEKIADFVKVVSWKDTKMIHQAGGFIPKEYVSKTKIIRVSRVGFSTDHNLAVVCVESHSGNLYFFEKADGPYWRPAGERNVWVS